MEAKTYSNKKIYAFALSIVSLIILSAYVGKIANFAALMIFCSSFFFFQKIEIYVLLFAIFPFANIFKLAPSAMSLATVCELVLFAFIIFDFFQNKVKIKGLFLFSVFLFAIYLVVGFFKQFSISVFVKMIIRPFILYYLFKSNYSCERKLAVTIGITYMLSISMLLMMVLSLNVSFLNRIIDYMRVVQIQNGLQLLTRNGGLFGDPNYCSLAILMTLSLLAVLYYSKHIGVIYWIFAVPLIVMGFTTYSKSFFLCIAAYAVLLTMLVLFPKHPMWGVFATIAVGIVVYAVLNGSIDVVKVIMDRFRQGDITTGRTSLNQAYFKYLFETPTKLFFGDGITAYAIAGSNNVHNFFIESLYKIGIVGSTIYAVIIGSCLYDGGKKKKLVVYIPAIFMLVMYFALAGLISFEFIYYIMICGIAAKYTGNEIEKR